MAEDRKQIALELAEKRGFAVFTLAEKSKKPHAGSNGFKDATRDPAAIEAMFTLHPNSNIAVATGAASGNLGIIDLDVDENGAFDGREVLAEWQSEHGKLPETACVVTGRGGTHIYYRFPSGVPDSYSNGVAHVDFRGEKGYAMLPGSVHPNGNEVYWDLDPDDQPIEDADANVLAFVEAFGPARVKGEGDAEGSTLGFSMPDELREGVRDETLFKYACSQRAKNVPQDVTLVAAQAYNKKHCSPPLTDAEVEHKVVSAYKYPAGSSLQVPAPSACSVETVSGADIWANPHLEAKVDQNGRIVGYLAPTVPALVWWLKEDPALAGVRFETMSQQVVVEGGLGWNPGATMWSPVDDDYLFSRVQERYKFGGKSIVRSDKNVFKAFSILCDERGFDALRAMLDELPEWDGVKRKDSLFIDFLGAEDCPYTREVTALLLRAALARAYDPGCKFDCMVVLQGPQGVGKSTMIRLLAVRPEFFVDDVKNIGTKDAQEQIQGRWFVEMAELAAFKGRYIETLKSFITSQVDSYRVPYAKRPVRLPRRCVLVGTTNLGEYLDDPTGNRRFLPVECSGKGTRSLFAGDARDYIAQVWAEALADYRANPKKPLVLPPELLKEADARRDRSTVEDPWVGIVQRFLAGKEHGQCVCTMQILCEAMGMERREVQQRDNMRVANIIKKHCPEWKKCPSNRVIEGFGAQRAYERKTEAELNAERFGVQGRLPNV